MTGIHGYHVDNNKKKMSLILQETNITLVLVFSAAPIIHTWQLQATHMCYLTHSEGLKPGTD